MSKTATVVISILATILVLAIIFFTCIPAGRAMLNQYDYSLQKVDEKTYEKQKEVEDTARSYIVQYNTDVTLYKTYANDTSSEKAKEYAEAARMRAIATANSYNEYIRKNSFVWKDSIPSDLPQALDTNIQ